ncbi:hypothetical protein [Streptomyces montanisoli]|uniref:LppX_LprAFG lipoprotein n=1 Tax=Streptomyces montanisoli TaxID=2798581 RepID=A0A940RWN0_9ACTN|nr:hypothetical protein [Streptomyces montanisoli]MBP0459640.1 hypothetical protein [Streptomyces montanisoli]
MTASIGRRGALAVTAALAVVVGVAGCQSDGGGKKDAAGAATPKASQQSGGDAVAAVQAVYKKTSGAKSAKARMTMTVPVPESTAGVQGASMSIQANGVVGWKPTALDMTMTMKASGAAADGLQMHEIMSGTTMYMNMGKLTAKQLGGKPWLKYDLADLAQVTGNKSQADLFSGSMNRSQDPAQQLGLLLKSPHIKDEGTQQVDGVKAHHYAASLTLDDITANASKAAGLSAKESAQIAGQLKKQGLTSEHIDLWVDQENYPVRAKMAMQVTAGAMTVDLHYSDYSDQAPKIQVPPASKTTDAMAAMKQAQAQGSAL